MGRDPDYSLDTLARSEYHMNGENTMSIQVKRFMKTESFVRCRRFNCLSNKK